MDALDVLRRVRAVVNTPYYIVFGVAAGRLIYYSDSEGVGHIYAMDLSAGEARRITREPPFPTAQTSHDSPYVVHAKEVSGGYGRLAI